MAEINVTPLVDVMLVLLIIFMVTAPLLMTGVKVDLPDTRARALEADSKPLQLSLDAAGKLYVDDQELAEADLPARLEAVAAAAPRTGPNGAAEPPQVLLRADKALGYGRVMRVIGELNRAGLNRVSLVTVEGD